MSRPCRWPDGGCGAEVEFVLTPAGKRQVLDLASAQKRIVTLMSGSPMGLEKAHPDNLYAVVATTYLDHHATCEAFKRYKAARP
jgi:hypothetical protein